ncbi:MAG: helix-hairpin-helix domain-containing protein [Promethearchaeota archaeon]
MSLRLEDIKGLGKKTIDSLKSAGIDTVEKLANTETEKLLEIKGIDESSAKKYIESAKELLNKHESGESLQAGEKTEDKNELERKTLKTEEEKEEEAKIEEELKKAEEKRQRLKGKPVQKGDFILVEITGKTQKGKVFQVSSIEDAKKAGIYEEEKAKQGYYSPEFVIVGKPGFLNEGLTETIEKMNYFEKKSVRIPPNKAFGKRDPQKIERIGIAKFKRINEGKNPQIGQEFVKKGTGQRGIITNIRQGKVIIDYNHPLAGQHLDYNIEIINKIEDFEEKIHQTMFSKGIPKENLSDFKLNYLKEEKTLEITIPKMFLFQNLTYFKFALAMDLQTNMEDEIDTVKFIEIYEKMPAPMPPEESVKKKLEEYTKKREEKQEEKEEKESDAGETSTSKESE